MDSYAFKNKANNEDGILFDTIKSSITEIF